MLFIFIWLYMCHLWANDLCYVYADHLRIVSSFIKCIQYLLSYLFCVLIVMHIYSLAVGMMVKLSIAMGNWISFFAFIRDYYSYVLPGWVMFCCGLAGNLFYWSLRWSYMYWLVRLGWICYCRLTFHCGVFLFDRGITVNCIKFQYVYVWQVFYSGVLKYWCIGKYDVWNFFDAVGNQRVRIKTKTKFVIVVKWKRFWTGCILVYGGKRFNLFPFGALYGEGDFHRQTCAGEILFLEEGHPLRMILI